MALYSNPDSSSNAGDGDSSSDAGAADGTPAAFPISSASDDDSSSSASDGDSSSSASDDGGKGGPLQTMPDTADFAGLPAAHDLAASAALAESCPGTAAAQQASAAASAVLGTTFPAPAPAPAPASAIKQLWCPNSGARTPSAAGFAAQTLLPSATVTGALLSLLPVYPT